jgi:hypothetical protein
MEEQDALLENWLDADDDPTWWVDPPRSPDGGGYLKRNIHRTIVNSEPIAVHGAGKYLHVGFDYELYDEAGYLGVDIRDMYPYLKFTLSGIGTVASAILYMPFLTGWITDNVPDTTYYIDVYHRVTQDASDFPQAILDAGDWEGSEKNELIQASWVDIKAVVAECAAPGLIWKELDVTTQVQNTLASGWDWFALRFQINPLYPDGWNYYNCPLAAQQICYTTMFGPTCESEGYDAPPDFPDSVGIGAKKTPWVPWLKIVFTGGEGEQPEPGEAAESSPVLCVAADCKQPNIAFAGTESGNLWKTSNGGDIWVKAYEVE